MTRCCWKERLGLGGLASCRAPLTASLRASAAAWSSLLAVALWQQWYRCGEYALGRLQRTAPGQGCSLPVGRGFTCWGWKLVCWDQALGWTVDTWDLSRSNLQICLCFVKWWTASAAPLQKPSSRVHSSKLSDCERLDSRSKLTKAYAAKTSCVIESICYILRSKVRSSYSCT